MFASRLCAALGVLLWLGAAAAEPPAPAMSDAELRRVLAHGPWPPAAARDPSNRVSGDARAIAFGERLFHDPRLSRDGARACATCHQREHGFSDGLPRADGMQRGDRNTPSLLNAGGQRWFGWDGANDNLWAQSLRPLLDAREMGGTLQTVAQVWAPVRSCLNLAGLKLLMD